VSKQRDKNFATVILGSLGRPLFWGMAAWVGFYVMVHQGVIQNELVRRYFANHPVEYVESAMFFVGLAALVLRLIDVLRQHAVFGKVKLPGRPAGGQPIEDCPALLKRLAEIPAWVKDSYLVRRLTRALEYVRRKGTADRLDDELRDLADADAAAAHDGYALVRIIIWAIPMLGFLGTVIGITMAIGGLSPEALVKSPEVAMEGLLAGLSVAFDTTALALSLSIVLMFTQFITDRIETDLLTAVDQRVAEELTGRFQQWGTGADPQVASAERMVEKVVNATDQLVKRQTELWQATVDAAHQQWCHLADSSQQQMESALSGALEQSMQAHAGALVQAEEAAAARNGQYAQQLRDALLKSAEVMKQQQSELVKQGDVMLKAVEASGRVAGLQQSLNDNLQSLAGANNFEDTVMSLSAAIHLLNARLGRSEDGEQVELDPTISQRPQDRAA